MSRLDTVAWTEGQVVGARLLREKGQQLEALIHATGMNERYRALALTELELVMMWANKGIGR